MAFGCNIRGKRHGQLGSFCIKNESFKNSKIFTAVGQTTKSKCYVNTCLTLFAWSDIITKSQQRTVTLFCWRVIQTHNFYNLNSVFFCHNFHRKQLITTLNVDRKRISFDKSTKYMLVYDSRKVKDPIIISNWLWCAILFHYFS